MSNLISFPLVMPAVLPLPSGESIEPPSSKKPSNLSKPDYMFDTELRKRRVNPPRGANNLSKRQKLLETQDLYELAKDIPKNKRKAIVSECLKSLLIFKAPENNKAQLDHDTFEAELLKSKCLLLSPDKADIKSGESILNTLEGRYPDHPRLLYIKALNLCDGYGQFKPKPEKAFQFLEDKFKEEKLDVYGKNLFACLAAENGKIDYAIAILNSLNYAEQEQLPICNFNLAILYWKQSDLKTAYTYLDRAASQGIMEAAFLRTKFFLLYGDLDRGHKRQFCIEEFSKFILNENGKGVFELLLAFEMNVDKFISKISDLLQNKELIIQTLISCMDKFSSYLGFIISPQEHDTLEKLIDALDKMDVSRAIIQTYYQDLDRYFIST